MAHTLVEKILLAHCDADDVRPGDVVMADINGVVIIPLEKLDEVLEAAEEIVKKEEAMVEELRKGVPILEVDRKFSYETMLKK